MRGRIAILGFMIAGAMLGAKPAGGPVNPHGTGREATPTEREFHLAPPVDPRWTTDAAPLPRPRHTDEMATIAAWVLTAWGGRIR